MMEAGEFQSLRRSSVRAAIVTGAGALLIFGAIIFATLEVQNAQSQLATLQAKRDSVSADIDNLTKQVADLEKKKNDATAQLANLSKSVADSLGYGGKGPRSTRTLVESVNALKAVETNAPLASGKSIVVNVYSRNFETDVNPRIILGKLKRLGFDVRYAAGRGAVSKIQTNAVWFGSGVAIADVKLLALTLMSAGVELRSIKPFADANGAKRDAMDVGADASFANAPPLTVDAVNAATSFSR